MAFCVAVRALLQGERTHITSWPFVARWYINVGSRLVSRLIKKYPYMEIVLNYIKIQCAGCHITAKVVYLHT